MNDYSKFGFNQIQPETVAAAGKAWFVSKQTVYVVILSDPYAEHLIAVFDSEQFASAWVAGARKDKADDERYVIIPMPVVQWPNS